MKSIKKSYLIKAEVEHVYTALTNPLTIEMWTGEPAVMKAEEGSEFSLWDGEITGMNLELVPNKKIKQQWYFEGEPAKSIVTLSLHAEGKNTRVDLLHTDIPEDAFKNILSGWDQYYFKPLTMLLED